MLLAWLQGGEEIVIGAQKVHLILINKNLMFQGSLTIVNYLQMNLLMLQHYG